MRFPLKELLFVPAVMTSLLTANAASHDQKSPVLAAPQAVRDALAITGGSVQNLALPSGDAWESFKVQVVFSGRTWTLDLEPYALEAPGFKMLQRTPDGTLIELPALMPTSYRGVVQGIPDSRVAANLFEGQLNATILLADTAWTIEPGTDALPSSPKSMHVVFNDDVIRPLPDFCQAVETDAQVPTPSGGAPEAAVLLADTAVELSPAFRNRWGGVPGAVNQARSIINGAGIIYERDTNIWLRIREMVVGNNYSSNGTAVLGQFRSRWLGSNWGFPNDFAHLLYGNPTSNVIGIAYINGICGSNRVSVSWHTSNLTSRRAVFAHEVGHTFAAQHCNGISGCRIMCSSIGGCGSITSFGPTSANTIRNRGISAPCVN
jgi:hypothetical protein